MNVEELMSKPAMTCRLDETLDTAAKKMWDVDCGVLPIVDGDGRLVGILTDRDICMSAWSRGRLLNAIRIEEAMSKQVFSVTPDQEVSVAELLMAENRIRRIPVIDKNGKPVGVVSMNDLAREAVRSKSRLKDGIVQAIHTLAAICQPRKREPKAA